MRRWVLALGIGAIGVAPAAAQNTVRWNDVVRTIDELSGTPPAVRLWLDQRVTSWGGPIRVGFEVEEDAFVVVARVDSDGRLTVLFPAGRSQAAAVRGGKETYIDSRRLGGLGTFPAMERPGSTGYVFALASRTPLDLTRLRQSDFSNWVTGVARPASLSRYFGDPYRVIQRFASVVSFSPDAEVDYDLEYYSVDQPAFVSAANGCAYGVAGSAAGTRLWNRGFFASEFPDETGPWGALGCSGMYSCLMPVMGFWWSGMPWSVPFFNNRLCGPQGATQVASGDPTVPPVAPPLDTPPVNPWAPDSVGRPNVSKGTNDDNAGGNANGPHVMSDRPAPIPGSWNDRDDLSFSIPSRALRAMRGANRSSEGGTPINAPGAEGSGPLPMTSRPQIEVAKEPAIEWVRPPRSFDAPPQDPVDRMPSLGGRRGVLERTGDVAIRPSGRMDYAPPPRMGSPMFEREPGRNTSFAPMMNSGGGFGGGGVYSGGGGGMYSPPASFVGEGRPTTTPGIYSGSTGGAASPGSITTGSSGTSGTTGGAASTPPASAAAAGTAGGEKKPQ